jgi:hypothetical protein
MKIVSVKKRTILLVAFLAFIALFTISIGVVLAAPKQKKSKVQRTPFMVKWVFDLSNADTGEQVITETGFLRVKDAIITGTVESDSSSPISGAVRAILSGTWDFNTLVGSFNGKWTITTDNGTFEGSVVGNVAVIYISGKIVGHGTNNLEGQKIMGSLGGTVNNYIVALTLQGELTIK